MSNSEKGVNRIVKTVLNSGIPHVNHADLVPHDGHFFKFNTVNNTNGIDTKEIHIDKERARALHGIQVPLKGLVEFDGSAESIFVDPKDISNELPKLDKNRKLIPSPFWTGVIEGLKLRNPRWGGVIQLDTELGDIIVETEED